MAVTKTDYYEVLGVPRAAGDDEIRTAFRALARNLHPDVSASPEAERRFRELAEAYNVLSKPSARLLYDKYGYRGRGNAGFDEELWETRERPARGANVHAEVDIRAYEAKLGTRRKLEYRALATCPLCEGRGATGGAADDCPTCGGTGRRSQVSDLDVARILQIESCPDCGQEICHRCEGRGRVEARRILKVRIPAGVEDGAQLRVAAEGGAAEAGGVSGDLLVAVRVLPRPTDSRFLRYLALAGLLAALALLIALLL